LLLCRRKSLRTPFFTPLLTEQISRRN